MTERFGRYELLRRIGAGGMAEVFRARTFGPQGFVKDVVIKRILPAFSEDPDFVHMFINEARLAARLQHTNVVQIFDFNQVDGVYYIAMEWVDGTDIKHIINRSRRRAMPIPLSAAVHVGVETLKGLHYAFTRSEDGKPLNLVHRDISPHNLLVSFAGEVKITDFGIAKVAALASATRTGMLKGKLGYMSPEQASGEVLDARSDIFSLGIVLWEMLAGRRVYQADSEAELFAQVKRATVPPIMTVRPDVSAELDASLTRMLAVDREERFSCAAQALEQLSLVATVNDGLTLSAYFRELMPDEVAREGQTGTEVLAPAPSVVAAGSDLPTHTREPRADESVARASLLDLPAPEPPDNSLQPDGQAIGAQLSGAHTTEHQGPRARSVSRVLGLVAVVAIGSVGGWLLGGGPTVGQPAIQSRTLRVESDPPNAILSVEGLEVGTTPTEITAPARTRLSLRVTLGNLALEQTVPVEQGQVNLVLRPIPIDASVRRLPDASMPSTSPPDAAVRLPTPDASRHPDATRARRPPRVVRHQGTPSRAPTPSPARPQGMGTLDVLVSPWAAVKLDGRELGNTPRRGIRLSAGRHRVDLFNPEMDKRATVFVDIKASKREILRRHWD